MFWTKNFLAPKFFGPNIFWTKNYYDLKFLGPKICRQRFLKSFDPNIFGPRIFFTPNLFLKAQIKKDPSRSLKNLVLFRFLLINNILFFVVKILHNIYQFLLSSCCFSDHLLSLLTLTCRDIDGQVDVVHG